MLLTKPPFPLSKTGLSTDDTATSFSYATPTTTPNQADDTPPLYEIPSTSAVPSTSNARSNAPFVYLEDIFEDVQYSPTGDPPRVRPHTPNPEPGAMSVDDETEDEATDAAVDLHLIAEDFLSHHLPNTLPSRIQRDQELQNQRLKQHDAEVLTAAIWGSYKTITSVLNDHVDDMDEAGFHQTCHQLLPFLSALGKKAKKQGHPQITHLAASFEHVDVDADFVILTGRDFLDRIQRVKAKCRAVSLSKLHGYTMPDQIEQEDVLTAHDINSNIRLTIGGGTSIPAPFPAHLLRDVPAVQRFKEVALPGTSFLDQVPTEVEMARILFGVCKTCASPRERCRCRNVKLQERRSYSPTYVTKTVRSNTFYVPPFLLDDFDLHTVHYELVYPGTCFLFSKVPPSIADARSNFRVCPDCGLSHKISLNSPPFTMLPTPTLLLCPYNTRVLAEKFVREFKQVESDVGKPAIPYASGRLSTRD
jgi:hypothetical protein